MKKDKFSVTQTGCQIVNAASGVVTNNPMGAQRKWIKLWVDPWLDGSTRYMNTSSERVIPTGSALNQIGQITQWRKEIGLLGRSP